MRENKNTSMNYIVSKLFILLLCFLSFSVAAKNSIVLLVEKGTQADLAINIATAQAAFDNFQQSKTEDAELAIISFADTPDVIQAFTVVNEATHKAIGQSLKISGFRSDTVNTAAGLERAISLLNDETDASNNKILLIVSDAKIETGDPETDQQFTEWMTQIISEDAQKSAITVQWHPLSKNANHANIDTFLENLDGNRVVVTPDEILISEASQPLPISTAQKELEEIQLATSSITTSTAEESIRDSSADPLPAAKTESALAPVMTSPDINPESGTNDTITENITDQSQPTKLDTEVEEERLLATETPETEVDLKVAQSTEPENTPSPINSSTTVIANTEPPTVGFFDNIANDPRLTRYGVLGLVALLLIAGFVWMLSRRRNQEDRPEQHNADTLARASDFSALAVPGAGASVISTRVNAPVIQARQADEHLQVLEDEKPQTQSAEEPEPLPVPQNSLEQGISETEVEDDSMDGTQEVFSDISSASISTIPLNSEDTEEPEPERLNSANEQNQASSKLQGDAEPNDEIISSAPKTAEPEELSTELPEDHKKETESKPEQKPDTIVESTSEPEIDPYATVIADASKIKEYAQKFSASQNPDSGDDDKTVLAPGIGGSAKSFAKPSEINTSDNKTVLVPPKK